MEKTVKIKVDGLYKTYLDARGRVYDALKKIDLEVYEGELLCLLGPSGCGKTTLLRIMAGFEQPSRGYVAIDGGIVEKPHVKYMILFQNYGLFPWRTVLGNTEYGLEVNGVPARQRKEKAMELVRLVGLEKFAHNHPHQLSGGMQQRTAVARALAVDPEVIFMDEPLGALDAMTRLKMQEEIVRLWQDKRKTIVFVTHDISEAVYLSDRIAIMSLSPGRISKLVDVPLGRPRNRSGADFARVQDFIYAEFEMSIREEIDYYI
ncbi:MAG: ABC transporter ATP-binding protein [Dethiobacter sp.]|jgi:NitT/TauT family transport system ATP-binding protein|nr:MAG: ABC transporter ATP-binding protein [Dethiobacter sp.]